MYRYMKIQDYYKNRDLFINEKRWDYDRRVRKAINNRIDELSKLLGIEQDDEFSDFVFSESCVPYDVLRKVFTTDTIRLLFKIFEKTLLIAKWDEPPNGIEKGGGKIGVMSVRKKPPVVDFPRGNKVYGPYVLAPSGFKIEEGEIKINRQKYDYKAVYQEAYLKEFMNTILKYYAKSQRLEDEFQIHHDFLLEFGLPSNLRAKLLDLEGDLSLWEAESKRLREFIEKEGLIDKYNLEKKHELEKKRKERRIKEIGSF